MTVKGVQGAGHNVKRHYRHSFRSGRQTTLGDESLIEVLAVLRDAEAPRIVEAQLAADDEPLAICRTWVGAAG